MRGSEILVRFDWNRFKNRNNRIAVHCKTEKEAEEFLGLMCRKEMMSIFYFNDLLNFYKIHKSETCYTNQKSYCGLKWFKMNGWEIWEYSDLTWSESENEDHWYNKMEVM